MTTLEEYIKAIKLAHEGLTRARETIAQLTEELRQARRAHSEIIEENKWLKEEHHRAQRGLDEQQRDIAALERERDKHALKALEREKELVAIRARAAAAKWGSRKRALKEIAVTEHETQQPNRGSQNRFRRALTKIRSNRLRR